MSVVYWCFISEYHTGCAFIPSPFSPLSLLSLSILEQARRHVLERSLARFRARPWFAKLEPDSGMVEFTDFGTLRSTHSCPPGGYYEVEIICCLAIKLLSSSSSPHLDSAVALEVLVGHCVSFE